MEDSVNHFKHNTSKPYSKRLALIASGQAKADILCRSFYEFLEFHQPFIAVFPSEAQIFIELGDCQYWKLS